MTPNKILMVVTVSIISSECLIVVPPWGDPKQNPCATKPNGWQLLYWPPEDKCYRIFQKGPPCPDSMELTPGSGGMAECQCPPGTARSAKDDICHKIYDQGPCNSNEYFSPITQRSGRWGTCVEAKKCDEGKAYWPQENKCYENQKKGPCPEGYLLYGNSTIGYCRCDKQLMPSQYWAQGNSCHEHYTQGPCEKGQIFLPGGFCGCNNSLQQYYPPIKQCYEIGTLGPCRAGHIFTVKQSSTYDVENYGQCICKEGHMFWQKDSICYRPYTRGPCEPGKMLNISKSEDRTVLSCEPIPCTAGKLYFLGGKGCHKIGTQGPCPSGQVVLFQENINTSAEGISYLGMCGCQSYQSSKSSFYPVLRADSNTPHGCSVIRNVSKQFSDKESIEKDLCETKHGMISWKDKKCYQLYSQGPCNEGEWMVPDRGKSHRQGRGWQVGKCECKPGYKSITLTSSDIVCQPPAVSIARYLNEKIENK